MDFLLRYINRNRLGDLYLVNPWGFKAREADVLMANPEPSRREFFNRPWLLKNLGHMDRSWVLLGTLAALTQAPSIKPRKMDESLLFKSNSVNGRFIVYDSAKGLVFLKIVVDPRADALECDSVILRTLGESIQKLVERDPGLAWLQRHFSRPLMSTQLLVDRVLVSRHTQHQDFFLDLTRVFGDDADVNGYWGSKGLSGACVPGFATNAAYPGIALGQILRAIRHMLDHPYHASRPRYDETKTDKHSKMLSHVLHTPLANRIYAMTTPQEYEAFVSQYGQGMVRTLKTRVLDKVAELIVALVKVGSHAYLSHGDLHTNNILYDMYDDAFIAIDFGRSYVRLVNDALIQQEHSKIQSPIAKHRTVDAKHFFAAFGSDMMRDPVDVHQNIKLQMYNVMNDVAGMCFSVWESVSQSSTHNALNLAHIMEYPFLDVRYDGNDNKYVLVAADLAPYVSTMSTLSPDDILFPLYPGMLWFAFYVHALLASQIVTKKQVYMASPSSAYWALDYEDVIGDDAPVYFAGQFMPDAYKDAAEPLENAIVHSKFLEHMQEWMKKVNVSRMAGGFAMKPKQKGVDHHHVVDLKQTSVNPLLLLGDKRNKERPFNMEEVRTIYEEHRDGTYSIASKKKPGARKQSPKKKLTAVLTAGSLTHI